jgi:hypothetical protein
MFVLFHRFPRASRAGNPAEPQTEPPRQGEAWTTRPIAKSAAGNAVKGHLARGRARLKAINAQAPAQPAPRPPSPDVARSVALFNGRAMLADDVR